MIGATLRRIFEEQGTNANELASRLHISPQTIYSILRRDNMKIDLTLLARICEALDVPIEEFVKGSVDITPRFQLSPDERELVEIVRGLDNHGRKIVRLIAEAEADRIAEEKSADPGTEEQQSSKIIPLYMTPAAAGYASPAFGDDYDDYAVPADSAADFAARIAGDSMEPYIHDGSIVLVQRGATIRDGDLGLFFVDGDMKCKQYCEDYVGNVYLFSLNRERKDADVYIPASSGITICCFGKVLLSHRVELPIDI